MKKNFCHHYMTLPIFLLTNLNCQPFLVSTNVPISIMKVFIYLFFCYDIVLDQCYCLFKDCCFNKVLEYLIEKKNNGDA